MKLRGLLTLALAAQAVVTAIALRASQAMTATAGPGAVGSAESLALLASAFLAVPLALICARAITAPPAKLSAAHRTGEADLRQALADSERETQAIVATALDAFVQTDDDGVVIAWSPQAEALTGWSRSEAVASDIAELIVPEPHRTAFRHRIKQRVREIAASPIGTRFETVVMHRNGDRILIEASSTALRLGGRVVINSFARDITARRVAEEQLVQAKKMEAVGQLTGGIAHEFNNMLTVITGTIEILADAVKDDAHLAAITKLISEAADRGAALTSSLLSFASRQSLQPARTEVNELIAEVARLMEATFSKRIEIATRLDRELWPALVDRGQLSSALLNLALNARDAMPAGGRLTLTTRNVVFGVREAIAVGVGYAGDYVEIEVADTGTGIAQSDLGRIFDPFFSTKGVGKGTGLGLSMVFGFVRQSGGSISVRSGEGQGTSFRICLPKADASAARVPRHEDRQPACGQETILCVEDDGDVRSYVTLQLESLGYKVIAAANAAEALAVAAQGAQFDLLFTDIAMAGGMNGRELAERMVAAQPSLRVLFTSGYAYDSLYAQGRAGQGTPLLTKPYRKAELARMLRRSLDTAVDAVGDPIPLPYSVQPELDRFLRQQASDAEAGARGRPRG